MRGILSFLRRLYIGHVHSFWFGARPRAGAMTGTGWAALVSSEAGSPQAVGGVVRTVAPSIVTGAAHLPDRIMDIPEGAWTIDPAPAAPLGGRHLRAAHELRPLGASGWVAAPPGSPVAGASGD